MMNLSPIIHVTLQLAIGWNPNYDMDESIELLASS